MLAGLIFCIGAVKHGTPTEKKNKELPEQAKFNKRLARDMSRPYLKSRWLDATKSEKFHSFGS